MNSRNGNSTPPEAPPDNVISLDDYRARLEADEWVRRYTENVNTLKLPPLSKETQEWLDQFSDL